MFSEICNVESMMNKKKLLVPLLAFLTDAALSLYTYLICTNYDQYKKYAKVAITDPEFQLELYKVIVQTFTFVLLLFLIFHLIIYVLYYRNVKFARQYVKFYLILALVSLVLTLLFSFSIYPLLACVGYGICLKYIKIAE